MQTLAAFISVLFESKHKKLSALSQFGHVELASDIFSFSVLDVSTNNGWLLVVLIMLLLLLDVIMMILILSPSTMSPSMASSMSPSAVSPSSSSTATAAVMLLDLFVLCVEIFDWNFNDQRMDVVLVRNFFDMIHLIWNGNFFNLLILYLLNDGVLLHMMMVNGVNVLGMVIFLLFAMSASARTLWEKMKFRSKKLSCFGLCVKTYWPCSSS